jgi:hypothetical protein
MKSLLVSVALGAGFLFSVGAYADAPAGSTAQCKDGTYYSGASHKGACKGHDGVKEWLDKTAATPAAKPAAAPAKKSTAAKSEAAPAATTTAAATSSKKKTTSKKTAAATAAPVTATPTAPSGATAQCKDGTYYSGASHKGACKGHQGVKEWLDGGAATTAAKPVAPPKTAPTPAPVATAPATRAPAATATAPAAAAPAAPAAPAAAATRTPPTPASQIEQKAGGGAGMVWVNSASKVYHCQGDEWYGKTKEGSYMSEAAATAAGNHASRGKECGK